MRIAIAKRRAFTMIEAMTAIALTAIAGSTLLLGVAASLRTADETMRETIAQGLAQQLLDEAVGCRYMELGDSSYAATPGPSAAEAAAGNRALFDDVGDFNGFRARPPVDAYGIALGADDGQGGKRNPAFFCRSAFLADWRQEIDVYYVAESDLASKLPSGQTSDYRAVEARIIQVDANGGERELARLRQVVHYVSPLSVN